MKYFFVLGSNPTLSIAELVTVLRLEGNEIRILPPDIFIMETDTELDLNLLLRHMGGVIKAGQIISQTNKKDTSAILDIIKKQFPENFGSKFRFGFSNYGVMGIDLKILGMETKRLLAERNISSRWVTSREKVLSSVVVTKNKLIEGFEIVFLVGHDGIFIGRTQAVQPFAELSFRDYGRPGRDDYSGMLPPKLAMIMINLTGLLRLDVETRLIASLPDAIILDPFCGSGTILTEAALLGFSNLIGSDISERAIGNTKKNLEWMRKSYKLKVKSYKLFNKNSLELSSFAGNNSIDAIVTEPYLGPARGKIDFKKVKNELEDLYSQSLLEFYKVLKLGGRVVMVWPVFRGTQILDRGSSTSDRRSSSITLDIDTNGFKFVNSIPEKLRDDKNINLTKRNTIVYGRPGQKVWREIVVLAKQSSFNRRA